MPNCPVCKAEVEYTPQTRNCDDGKPHSCVDFDNGVRRPSRPVAVKITTTEKKETNQDG